jgi:hypothetical protein
MRNGPWLAVALLTQLGVAYLIPFVALRRRGWTLLGCLLALIVAGGATVAAHGSARSLAYARGELAGLTFVPGGTAGDPGASAATTTIAREGRSTRMVSFEYALAASASQAVGARMADRVDGAASKVSFMVSWAMTAAGLIAAAVLVGRRRRPPGFGPKLPAEIAPGFALGETAFWQAAFAVAIAASPLSSAPDAVWCLPAVLLAVRVVSGDRTPTAKPARIDRWAAVLVLDLLLAGMPDHHSFPLLLPRWTWLSEHKYFMAELLIAVAGLFMARAYFPLVRATATAPAARPQRPAMAVAGPRPSAGR